MLQKKFVSDFNERTGEICPWLRSAFMNPILEVSQRTGRRTRRWRSRAELDYRLDKTAQVAMDLAT